MSALDKVPSNINFLSPLSYQFVIRKLPHVNFFLQGVNLPSLRTEPTPQHTNPFVKTPYSGEHITYSKLRLTFKVDEDMNNYLELMNWMRGLAFPESFDESAALAAKNRITGEGQYSDASLLIGTSLKNPNIDVTFTEIFPIELGELRFTTTATDVNYITCEAEFDFTLFNINVL